MSPSPIPAHDVLLLSETHRGSFTRSFLLFSTSTCSSLCFARSSSKTHRDMIYFQPIPRAGCVCVATSSAHACACTRPRARSDCGALLHGG